MKSDIIKDLDSAVDLIELGHFDKAIKSLTKLLDSPGEHTYYIRNNLSMAYYYTEDYQMAYETIIPNRIYRKKMSSFFEVSVMKIEYKLGKKNNLNKNFKKVLEAYNVESKLYDNLGHNPESWYEYANAILLACLEFGLYKELIKFYQKYWRQWLNDRYHLYAMFAAYNLKRYDQINQFYRRISEENRACMSIEQVVINTQSGLIPHFIMGSNKDNNLEEYSSIAKPPALDSTVFPSLLNNFLEWNNKNLITDEDENYMVMIKVVIETTGQWGIELGNNILQSPIFKLELKHNVLDALVELGVYKYGEHVMIEDEGNQVSIASHNYSLIEESQETKLLVKEIKLIFKKENAQKALKAFTDKQSEIEGVSPQMMVVQAELFMACGFKECALSIIDHIETELNDVLNIKKIRKKVLSYE